MPVMSPRAGHALRPCPSCTDCWPGLRAVEDTHQQGLNHEHGKDDCRCVLLLRASDVDQVRYGHVEF